MTVVELGESDKNALLGSPSALVYLVLRLQNTKEWTCSTGHQVDRFVDLGHGPGAADARRIYERTETAPEAAYCSMQAAVDLREADDKWLVYNPLATGVSHMSRVYVGNTSRLQPGKFVKPRRDSLFSFHSQKEAWDELIRRTKYTFRKHGCLYDKVGLAYQYGRLNRWYVKDGCNHIPSYQATFAPNGTLDVLNYLADEKRRRR